MHISQGYRQLLNYNYTRKLTTNITDEYHEKYYQDWLETYVDLVLGENKIYTNFGRDAHPGNIYV